MRISSALALASRRDDKVRDDTILVRLVPGSFRAVDLERRLNEYRNEGRIISVTYHIVTDTWYVVLERE